MLTRECTDIYRGEDVGMSRELRLIQDIAGTFGCWLMGLFGMLPLLDAE